MVNQELILVDEMDRPIGTMDKMEVHQKGLLHRAFSVFIFNSQGEMLLQQRADEKYHSPGLWTNACCSHPGPGEEVADAAARRLNEELGFETPLRELFSFTYRAQFDNGLIEHEYDHVFVGMYDGKINADRSEVKNHEYLSLQQISNGLIEEPEQYTFWFHIAFPRIQDWASEKSGAAVAQPLFK
ncbi:MAG: isopentenyl-diphosphate Delta-isomerase [Chitinophagaceae bacterium]|nr:isopentenyl-diphosphate Delta-isomerase [Chitinophagaceae bacterium]